MLEFECGRFLCTYRPISVPELIRQAQAAEKMDGDCG